MKANTHIFKPVDGYKWTNYDRRYGINASGEDVVSNLVVEQVRDAILDGYSTSYIYQELKATYGMNSYSASFIVQKAMKELQRSEERQEDGLIYKQNARLFKLYRESLEKGDQKTTLAILAEINKLNSLYTKKIEVSTDVFQLDLGLNDNFTDEDKQ